MAGGGGGCWQEGEGAGPVGGDGGGWNGTSVSCLLIVDNNKSTK